MGTAAGSWVPCRLADSEILLCGASLCSRDVLHQFLHTLWQLSLGRHPCPCYLGPACLHALTPWKKRNKGGIWVLPQNFALYQTEGSGSDMCVYGKLSRG